MGVQGKFFDSAIAGARGRLPLFALVLLMLTLVGCGQTEKPEEPAPTYRTLEEVYADTTFREEDQEAPIPLVTVERDGYVLGILYNEGTPGDTKSNIEYYKAFAVQIVDDGYRIADASVMTGLKDLMEDGSSWAWFLLDNTYALYIDFGDNTFLKNLEDLGSNTLPNGQAVHFWLERDPVILKPEDFPQE